MTPGPDEFLVDPAVAISGADVSVTFRWIPRYPDETDEAYADRRARMEAAFPRLVAASVEITPSADLSDGPPPPPR